MMDEFGSGNNNNNNNSIRRKRTQTCRRPKAEVQVNHDQASSTDEASKISSDDDGIGNPKRKVFNLNQCDGRRSSNGDANENKLKKVKLSLKVGGVTRTIQPKSNVTDAPPRPRPKLILQENSDEEDCSASASGGKKIGLQGVPWKDFSRGGGFSLGLGSGVGRESSSNNNSSSSMGEKGQGRKNKRVPKKKQRLLNDEEEEEEEDDEIRYLEKLKTVKVAASASRGEDLDDESPLIKKHHSRVSNSISSVKKSDSVEDTTVVSVEEEDDEKKAKKETSLTSRQRALLSGSASAAANQIQFPNGLPPAPPRKQKEKLTEVEQQLKKAEAAERRRIQNEKAARESEAEAIRKILGQDSSRKKREDKLKKRQEELAQEKAANAKMVAPSTIRTVMTPTGTVVAFADDIGLPHIFDLKSTCYPPPREKCAGPSCPNPYKYRDSKSKLPLCSLQCYKAIHSSTYNA